MTQWQRIAGTYRTEKAIAQGKRRQKPPTRETSPVTRFVKTVTFGDAGRRIGNIAVTQMPSDLRSREPRAGVTEDGAQRFKICVVQLRFGGGHGRLICLSSSIFPADARS
jgi:hypothetical protein